MNSISEHVRMIGCLFTVRFLPQKRLGVSWHIRKIIRDQKKLDGCLVWVFDNDLNLTFGRDTITGLLDTFGLNVVLNIDRTNIRCRLVILKVIKGRRKHDRPVWRTFQRGLTVTMAKDTQAAVESDWL